MSTTHAHPPAETNERRREDPQSYVQQRRAFSIHTRVYAASMVGIIGVNAAINAAAGLSGEWWAWWSVPALLGWGVGVIVHGVVVRMSRSQMLGPSPEARQIDEIVSSEGIAPSQ